MGGLDLLMVSDNTNQSLLLSLFQLILGKIELDGVLVLIDFPYAECGHADIDKDDGLYSISQ